MLSILSGSRRAQFLGPILIVKGGQAGQSPRLSSDSFCVNHYFRLLSYQQGVGLHAEVAPIGSSAVAVPRCSRVASALRKLDARVCGLMTVK